MVAKRFKLLKYFCFLLLAVFFFALQVTPGLFAIGGARPMLLVGLAVSFAFYEDALAGGIFGAVCGYLCDFYGYDVMGFYTVMLFLCCVAVGVLASSYVTTSVVNCAAAVFATMLLIQLVSFFFQLVLWRHEGAGSYLLSHVLPITIYTAVASAPVFLLTRWMWTGFQRKIEV